MDHILICNNCMGELRGGLYTFIQPAIDWGPVRLMVLGWAGAGSRQELGLGPQPSATILASAGFFPASRTWSKLLILLLKEHE